MLQQFPGDVNPSISLAELADVLRRRLWQPEFCLSWPAISRELALVEADIRDMTDLEVRPEAMHRQRGWAV